jgi:hypothetical protein
LGDGEVEEGEGVAVVEGAGLIRGVGRWKEEEGDLHHATGDEPAFKLVNE